MNAAKTYVVVLNWNGWPDTLECLETVLRSDHGPFQIVVCDNGSTDGSLDRIREWADGRLSHRAADDERLRTLSMPPHPKPLRWLEYDRETAEAGGDQRANEASLVLISSGENLGFAGGSNIGLRYALARGDMDFVWLLNNDTAVHSDTLGWMVEKLQRTPDAGLCGSLLLYYSRPETVQATGGFEYNRWFGLSRQIGQHSNIPSVPEALEAEVEGQMFGVQGASVLVRRAFLERVGLLSESYFLYFEEQDWAVRARRAGFRIVFAARSVVYHKEGAATGGGGLLIHQKSELSDYHAIRSRLIFTREHFPLALPTVYLSLLGTIVNRVRRGQIKRVPMILRLLLESRGRGAKA
ncbi:MAG: glycosyltransferase family 2 protein [Gemmatimonadetes bacterium]|nr:glycosyltransferase family 2 protein [Gemmatimonadota bacterium]